MYAPNFAQAFFGEVIFKQLLLDQESEILMLGDFNAILDKHQDRSKVSSALSISANFLHYKELLGLVDIWRKANEVKRDYTFHSYCHTTYSRIDLVLTSERLSHWLDSPQIGLRTLSDHAPVSVIWVDNPGVLRPWLWRWNNYLLESPGLVEYVKAEIQAVFTINDDLTRVCLVWDAFKALGGY